MHLGQAADQQVLRPVRVLVLVHHHVLELARVALADLLRGLEELDRLQQQIVEVERVGVAAAPSGSARRSSRSARRAGSSAPRSASGPFHAVLRLADPRQRHPRRHELVVDAELASAPA